MSRLRADIWVAAYIRRCGSEGVPAMLRRRGSAEAGAIFIKVDLLDGTSVLYGPAPQSENPDAGVERLWQRIHKDATLDNIDAEARLKREISFDHDLWIIEIEDCAGRHFLDLADAS